VLLPVLANGLRVEYVSPSDLVQPGEQLLAEPRPALADLQGRPATRRVDELRPHPSYERHNLAVSASQLSALAERGDRALQEPIMITRDGTIIDGYARWELAKLKNRPTLPCLEYDLTSEEALQKLLETHRRLNGFSRVPRMLLALDLEPFFREKARANQQLGGQIKGLSILPKAELINVRAQVAAAAGVSATNVAKLKQLLKTVHPKVLQATKVGEVSLHRAWLWRKLPGEEQFAELQRYQSQRGTKRTIHRLIRKHAAKRMPNPATRATLGDLLRPFSTHESRELDLIDIVEINAPGNTAFLTKRALRTLRSLEK
jgi:hypothetical protein